MHDVPSTNLAAHFNAAFRFINAAINDSGIVFVHCFAGASRSATIVIAYLMKERGMSLREAYRFVKSKRCFINPNEGFVKQLQRFEKSLKGRKSVEPGDEKPSQQQSYVSGMNISALKGKNQEGPEETKSGYASANEQEKRGLKFTATQSSSENGFKPLYISHAKNQVEVSPAGRIVQIKQAGRN